MLLFLFFYSKSFNCHFLLINRNGWYFFQKIGVIPPLQLGSGEYLKDRFVILCFKSAEVRNSEVVVSKKLQLAGQSLIIGHYYNTTICFR